MRTTRQMSVIVPHDMADMVRAKVTSGEYACESEVIRDGLRALARQPSRRAMSMRSWSIAKT